MSDELFRVSRRWAGTPYDLFRHQQALPFLSQWYEPMTPFLRAIGYGLFALTDDQPDQFQEVAASDLLEVIEVGRHLTGSGTEAYHGQHYRDAFDALERLFNVAVPLKTKKVRREGRRRSIVEHRVDFVRLLDGFGLAYLNSKGQPISTDGDPNLEPYRLNINARYADEQTQSEEGGGRPRRRRKRASDERPVWALVRVDPRTRQWRRDGEGKPVLRTPDRYRFRWSREIVNDLLGTPEGRGWLRANRAIFRVMRNLRHACNGRGCPTATYLLDLIVSDLLPSRSSLFLLEKSAKLIFACLGFSSPGTIKKRHMHKCDGRWSENVARVAEAVRLLKAEGVLLPESDEEPRVDTNLQRRRAPYYRWRRAANWTFTTAIEIVDRTEGRDAVQDHRHRDDGQVAPPRGQPQSRQLELFDSPPFLRGRDIRAARAAAGLTLRDFQAQFGSSIYLWSQIENEVVQRRTRQPTPVPPAVLDEVAAFVAQYLPQPE